MLGWLWLRCGVIHLPGGIVEESMCLGVVLPSLFWCIYGCATVCAKYSVKLKLYNRSLWTNIWNQVPLTLKKNSTCHSKWVIILIYIYIYMCVCVCVCVCVCSSVDCWPRCRVLTQVNIFSFLLVGPSFDLEAFLVLVATMSNFFKNPEVAVGIFLGLV
jgi:hypothetical protein